MYLLDHQLLKALTIINAAVLISRMPLPVRIPRLSYVNGALGRGKRDC